MRRPSRLRVACGLVLSSSSGVFDLLDQPRENRSLVDLSEDLRPLGDSRIDDPSAALIRRLARHIPAFRSMLEKSDRQELDAVDRRMLKSLGYL